MDNLSSKFFNLVFLACVQILKEVCVCVCVCVRVRVNVHVRASVSG